MTEPLDNDPFIFPAGADFPPPGGYVPPPPPAFVAPAKKNPVPLIILAVVATVIVLSVGIALGSKSDTKVTTAVSTSTTMSSDEITNLALQVVWDQQTASDQRSMCALWRIDPDEMLDAISDGWDTSHGSTFPRSQARIFFNGQC